MPAQLSHDICPNCNQRGGFPTSRLVKYAINIPPRRKIKSAIDAWEYGARICLKCAEQLMMFPLDDSMSIAMPDKFYNFWRKFTFHNDMEIKLFQAKFLDVIPKSLKSRIKYLESKYKRSHEHYDGTSKLRRQTRNPIHLKLPSSRHLPSKASTSFVYAACVCLALKDVFGYVSFDNNDQLVTGIYTFFSILFQPMTDHRVFGTWTNYFRIYQDVRKYGYYRASRLTKQVSNICKYCLEKKKRSVEMSRISDTGTWKCSNCEGNTPIILHFSIPHLKRKKKEVRAKYLDCVESIPVFLESLERIINYLKSHQSVITELRTLFNKYALETEKGTLFATRRYFWGHYDNTKKSKKRWCSLNSKGITQ